MRKNSTMGEIVEESRLALIYLNAKEKLEMDKQYQKSLEFSLLMCKLTKIQ